MSNAANKILQNVITVSVSGSISVSISIRKKKNKIRLMKQMLPDMKHIILIIMNVKLYS